MSLTERAQLDASEFIWRRIHPNHMPGGRLSTAAFRDDEMSVDRRHIIEEMGLGVEYTRQNGVGVAELQVVAVEEIAVECGVELTAVEDALHDDPAHALVLGKKPKNVQRAFVARSNIIA